MPSAPRPAPRKTPRQERSRALVAAILSAAAELLEKHGPELTLSEVAARAGVAAGSLYQYFPDRTALIAALVDRQLEADRAAIASFRDAAPSATELPELLVSGVLELYGARPKSMASMVALLHELGRDGEVAALTEELCGALAVQLELGRPEVGAKPCHEAATTAVHALLGIVRRAASEAPEQLSGDAAFRARLLRVARAALSLD